MLKVWGKDGFIVKGDYKPVSIYNGNQPVFVPMEANLSGTDIEIPNTYNDEVEELTVYGKCQQEHRKIGVKKGEIVQFDDGLSGSQAVVEICINENLLKGTSNQLVTRTIPVEGESEISPSFCLSELGFGVGDTFTVSCYIGGIDIANISIAFAPISKTTNIPIEYFYGNMINISTYSEKQAISKIHLTIGEDWDLNAELHLLAQTHYERVEEVEFSFGQVKIEKGDVYTPWIPNQEDLDEDGELRTTPTVLVTRCGRNIWNPYGSFTVNGVACLDGNSNQIIEYNSENGSYQYQDIFDKWYGRSRFWYYPRNKDCHFSGKADGWDWRVCNHNYPNDLDITVFGNRIAFNEDPEQQEVMQSFSCHVAKFNKRPTYCRFWKTDLSKPLHLKNIQLTLGITQYEYEPYVGETFEIPINTPFQISLLDGVNTFFVDAVNDFLLSYNISLDLQYLKSENAETEDTDLLSPTPNFPEEIEVVEGQLKSYNLAEDGFDTIPIPNLYQINDVADVLRMDGASKRMWVERYIDANNLVDTIPLEEQTNCILAEPVIEELAYQNLDTFPRYTHISNEGALEPEISVKVKTF